MAENITGTGALSRRDFLTGSAVAAAGAAMLGLAAAEPAGFDWSGVFGRLESMWSGEYGPWLAQELL